MPPHWDRKRQALGVDWVKQVLYDRTCMPLLSLMILRKFSKNHQQANWRTLTLKTTMKKLMNLLDTQVQLRRNHHLKFKIHIKLQMEKPQKWVNNLQKIQLSAKRVQLKNKKRRTSRKSKCTTGQKLTKAIHKKFSKFYNMPNNSLLRAMSCLKL